MKNIAMIIVFLGSILIVYADAEYDPFSKTSENNKPSVTSPEPDHLQPISPYPGEVRLDYMKLLTKHFKLDSGHFARMVVLPSFSAEYSIQLHGDKDNYNIKGAKDFFLTYIKADKSIWFSMPNNNDERKRKDVNVVVLTTPIREDVAKRIYKLWNEMILRTRYSRNYGTGLDGVSIEFSSLQGHAAVWSPRQRKSPLFLCKVGEAMVEYCKAPPEHKQEVMKKLERRIITLEVYLRGARNTQP